MTHILFITTSPRGEASLSTRVASTLVDSLTAAVPGATVTRRDLDTDSLPHIGQAFTSAMAVPPEDRDEAQREAIARSDALIAGLMAADIVVIASAMINFGVTSTLKAWIDYVTRAGVTFRYTPEGVPEGLVKGKKVYLVTARGGVYSEGPGAAGNFQDTYLKYALGFIGMTDLEVIPVEGVLLGPDRAEQAVAQATERAQSVSRQAA